MSLFACENCGCVENTATSHYWIRKAKLDKRALCSQCDPDIGKWHGLFDRSQPTDDTHLLDRSTA